MNLGVFRHAHVEPLGKGHIFGLRSIESKLLRYTVESSVGSLFHAHSVVAMNRLWSIQRLDNHFAYTILLIPITHYPVCSNCCDLPQWSLRDFQNSLPYTVRFLAAVV